MSHRARPDDPQPPILRIWRHRNYALFVSGVTPHFITSWIQRVGVGWLAWELTHSPVWLGAVAAADLAPIMVLAPFAGAITDRVDSLWLSRISQVFLVLQAVVLASLALTGLVTIELLLALSLVSGIAQPFAQSSRVKLLPSLIPREDFTVAVALDSVCFHGSRFIGPAIAAFLIPTAGVGGTFLAHVAGSTVFMVLLMLVEAPPPGERTDRRHNLLLEVKDGLAYVRSHGGIAPVFMMLTVVSMFVRPVQDMLPGFAGAVFHSGPVGLAWLISSMGAGAMVASGLVATRGRVQGLTYALMLGCLGLAVATAGFVATTNLWIGLLFAALSGFTLNGMSTCIQVLVQTAVSEEMRGRVMSLYIVIFRGTPAVGALAVGLLAEQLGLRLTFAAGAALCFAAWLAVAPRREAIAASLEETQH
jgi:MFS family permease